jgi:23S rRNA A1618 N6-methylase RlmF
VFKTDRYIATVARAALKRKKVLEQNLITTQQHINTLEQQMNAVETANLNLETVKVMKEASDAMKIMNKRVGINDIDETMCVQPFFSFAASFVRFDFMANIEVHYTGRRSARTCNSTRKSPKLSQT